MRGICIVSNNHHGNLLLPVLGSSGKSGQIDYGTKLKTIPEDSSQCCSLKKKGVFLETSQGLAMLSGFCVLWVLLAIRFKSRAGDLVVGTKTDFTVGSDINQTLEVNNSSELLLVFPPHLHN